MVDFSTREGIMEEWNRWVRYYRSGGGGTWPADAFESLLDYFDEQRQLTNSSKAADACRCGRKPIALRCNTCGGLVPVKQPPPA